jgi:hypothetical protein
MERWQRGGKANCFAFAPIFLKEKISLIERSEIGNRWANLFDLS